MESISPREGEDPGSNPGLSAKYDVVVRIDESLVIAKVHINVFREQDLNARVMSKPMFRQLVKNIKDRGVLESVPYCALTDRGIEIVSGHHRLRGLRAAKFQGPVYILLETKPMSRSEITAKQLAHNSIQGVDDPTILKKLYLSIDDANLRLLSFVDETKLELPQPQAIQLSKLSTGLDFKNVKLLFLPFQLEDFEQVIETFEGDETKLFVAPLKDWDAFKSAISKIIAADDIHSIGTAVARMSEIVLNHYSERQK